MDFQWFTLKSTMPKETTVMCVSHTANHCRLTIYSQWSTADVVMVLGTTLPSITM